MLNHHKTARQKPLTQKTQKRATSLSVSLTLKQTNKQKISSVSLLDKIVTQKGILVCHILYNYMEIGLNSLFIWDNKEKSGRGKVELLVEIKT